MKARKNVFGLIVVLSSLSIVQVACTVGHTDQGSSNGDSQASAQPLLSTCSGTYTCADDSGKSDRITLRRSGALCEAGEAVIEADHEVTTDGGAGHQLLGKWDGDSLAFSICASDGCLRCTSAAGTSTGNSEAKSGSCTGITSCSDYGAGDCSTHQGCSLHSHAVYSFGHLDHYENECQGSTPSCSSHDTQKECVAQDCTWK